MPYSLRHPPRGLLPLQVLLWPWIWAQLVALKLWVRKHYGRGVPYRFEVSRFGRVRLVSLPSDLTWGYTANAPLLGETFRFTAGLTHPALALALAPEIAPRAPAPLLRTGTILMLSALRALLRLPAPDTS